MTINKFEQIKRYLHYNDNSTEIGKDRLHKIRPLVDLLRHEILKIPMKENVSIDEKIVPLKGRSSLQQYNPQKPHKWGYKIYVISGSGGFAYYFEIYN